MLYFPFSETTPSQAVTDDLGHRNGHRASMAAFHGLARVGAGLAPERRSMAFLRGLVSGFCPCSTSRTPRVQVIRHGLGGPPFCKPSFSVAYHKRRGRRRPERAAGFRSRVRRPCCPLPALARVGRFIPAEDMAGRLLAVDLRWCSRSFWPAGPPIKGA